MAANYDANRYQDPALQRLRGRGGFALGGPTLLGSSGSGSMGRQRPPSGGSGGQRTPTFLNSSAYFNAQGSGLDWLQKYGPNREQGRTAAAPATYGGRSAPPSGGMASVGGGISGTNPYTELTGDAVDAPLPLDTTPNGRYDRMKLEGDMLLSQGLADGQAAVAEMQEFQNAPNPRSQGSIIPTVDGSNPGSVLRSPYGSGSFSLLGGGPRSFGSTRASSPQQSRQDDIGDRAIASRNRAGISTSSLLDSYARRMNRQR